MTPDTLDISYALFLTSPLPLQGVFITYRARPSTEGLVWGRTTEVLSTLQSLSLEVHPYGPVQEVIGELFAARQLSGHQ